jgi:hypothetical protein
MTELPGWAKARIMWIFVVGSVMVLVYLLVRYLGELI